MAKKKNGTNGTDRTNRAAARKPARVEAVATDSTDGTEEEAVTVDDVVVAPVTVEKHGLITPQMAAKHF